MTGAGTIFFSPHLPTPGETLQRLQALRRGLQALYRGLQTLYWGLWALYRGLSLCQ